MSHTGAGHAWNFFKISFQNNLDRSVLSTDKWCWRVNNELWPIDCLQSNVMNLLSGDWNVREQAGNPDTLITNLSKKKKKVEYLKGWQQNQGRKALSVADYKSKK